ncbi:MAG: formamidopyrimidine-DNA glycosylase [Gammaproteobacteria bacterium]|nr:formamidopyrimidine-DNA glycosylase [Gammaproteobacteria bacterium]
MPELPDVTIYVERLEAMVCGGRLSALRVASPFLLRTVSPTAQAFVGRSLRKVHRIGKRIALEFDDEYLAVIHLMIAGRLRWKKPGTKVPARNGLAAFEFDTGTLVFTEASKKKRASLHLIVGVEGLGEFDRGGLSVLHASFEEFQAVLSAHNHTLKRALTDPSVLDGIGNAYSDEILHRAKMSPFKQTKGLASDEVQRLYEAAGQVLNEWTVHHREAVGENFPDKVTAFHTDMAVHGKYRQPCPSCGAPIQRIVYAENECNYCAKCQTGGRVLADRSLSRLLKKNWPRTIEELEVRLPSQKPGEE